MVLQIPELFHLKDKSTDITGSIKTPMPCKISQVYKLYIVIKQ